MTEVRVAVRRVEDVAAAALHSTVRTRGIVFWLKNNLQTPARHAQAVRVSSPSTLATAAVRAGFHRLPLLIPLNHFSLDKLSPVADSSEYGFSTSTGGNENSHFDAPQVDVFATGVFGGQ